MANTAAKLVSSAKNYIGFNEQDGSYKMLIDTYNKLDPLPEGYQVKYTDSWCAAGLTAIFILSGMRDLVPAECGVQRMFEKGKKAGSQFEKPILNTGSSMLQSSLSSTSASVVPQELPGCFVLLCLLENEPILTIIFYPFIRMLNTTKYRIILPKK